MSLSRPENRLSLSRLMTFFTKTPTGFRILNFKKKMDQGEIQITFGRVKKAIRDTAKDRDSIFRSRESQVEDTLEKVLCH